MAAPDKHNHRSPPTVPAFLRRSGIKIKEGVREAPAEPGAPPQPDDDPHIAFSDTRRHAHRIPTPVKAATQGFASASHPGQRLAFKPRSFLNGLSTITLPRSDRPVSNLNTMGTVDEVDPAEANGDKDIPCSATAQDPDEDTVMESVESDRLGVGPAANDGLRPAPVGTNTSRGGHDTREEENTQSRTIGSEECDHNHGASIALESIVPVGSEGDRNVDEATTATSEPKLTPAMAAYEVAREYRRRVDNGEVKRSKDQDRANYVNWKRNYKAFQAQKQREGEEEHARERAVDDKRR